MTGSPKKNPEIRNYDGRLKPMTLRAAVRPLALAFALASACPNIAFALGGTSVSAGNCSIASVGESSSNSITCNFGLTSEQLREVTKAAVEGATGPLIDRIADIGKTLGVTANAAKGGSGL
jgi:hypothetical protein